MKYVFEIATGPATKAVIVVMTIICIAATAICCASTETGISGIIALTISGYFPAKLKNIAVVPASGPAGGAAPVGRGTRTAQAAAAAQNIATVSMMDSAVPSIPEMAINDIEKEIPHPTLTRIEGELDYASMSIV